MRLINYHHGQAIIPFQAVLDANGDELFLRDVTIAAISRERLLVGLANQMKKNKCTFELVAFSPSTTEQEIRDAFDADVKKAVDESLVRMVTAGSLTGNTMYIIGLMESEHEIRQLLLDLMAGNEMIVREVCDGRASSGAVLLGIIESIVVIQAVIPPYG
jgi:hypothetical protein